MTPHLLEEKSSNKALPQLLRKGDRSAEIWGVSGHPVVSRGSGPHWTQTLTRCHPAGGAPSTAHRRLSWLLAPVAGAFPPRCLCGPSPLFPSFPCVVRPVVLLAREACARCFTGVCPHADTLAAAYGRGQRGSGEGVCESVFFALCSTIRNCRPQINTSLSCVTHYYDWIFG